MERASGILQSQKKIITLTGNHSQQEQESGEDERISQMLEEENRFKERKINEFIAERVGNHYAKKFTENKIRQKEQLDALINEMLEKGTGIIISGSVGVGKTMDLIYIIRRIVKAQSDYKEKIIPSIPIAYYFMPDLFQKLHYGERVKLNKFVMLDDWGREYAEPFALSQFEEFTEKVYSKEYILIATTNLTKEQFLRREGWLRITDRVREMCAFIEIRGGSQRKKWARNR